MAFNFKENVDLKKDAGWLLPGLEVKRWFLLIFLGSIMIVLGFMVLANVRPIYLTLELIRKAALVLPSNVLAAIFILMFAPHGRPAYVPSLAACAAIPVGACGQSASRGGSGRSYCCPRRSCSCGASSARRFHPPCEHDNLIQPVQFALLDRIAVMPSDSFRPRAARCLWRRQRQRSRNLPMWRWPHGQIWAVRERLVLWILLWLSWPLRNSQAKWIPPMWQKFSVHPHTSAAPLSIAVFPE